MTRDARIAAGEGPAADTLPVFGGRYAADMVVGGGGTSVVLRAVDRRAGGVVAVKWLRAPDPLEIEHDPEVLRRRVLRFQREQRLHARIRHPCCVASIDQGEHDGRPWYAMEFVAGTHLRTCFGRSPPVIADLGLQIASALEHIHAAGVIHRDLTPRNVIVEDQDGAAADVSTCGLRARVMDFGIAREVDDDTTSHGAIMGTLAYLSPEQAQGRDLDPRSDLYALGVILYEALTGRHPITGLDERSPFSAIYRIIHEEPVPLRTWALDVPESFAQLVMRLLAKDRGQRFNGAGDVVRGLGEVLRDHFDLTSPVGPSRGTGHLLCPAMVGRDSESAALGALIERLRAAPSSEVTPVVAAISGAAGAGKTRLLGELCAFAWSQRINVVKGTCVHGSQTAWSPVIQVLEQLVRRLSTHGRGTREGAIAEGSVLDLSMSGPRRAHAGPFPETLSASDSNIGITAAIIGSSADAVLMRRLLDACGPDLVKVMPGLRRSHGYEPSPPLEPPRERLRLLRAMTQVILAAATPRPLLVVWEDMHEADQGTLDLLAFLVRAAHRAAADVRAHGLPPPRLMVVASYRPEADPGAAAFARVLATLGESARCHTFALRPLDVAEVARVVSSMLGLTDDAPVRQAATALHAVTGGNPFFLGEALRSLHHAGLMTSGEGDAGRVLPDLSRVDLPASVAAMARARLETLDAATRDGLEVAAVLGFEVHVDVWTAAGIAPEGVLDVADRLVHAGFLHDTHAASGRYRFAHDAIRAAVYDGIEPERRRALHERIGQALAGARGDGTALAEPGLVAYHLARGEVPAAAVSWLVRAARRAREDHAAFAAALGYYQEALSLTDAAMRETGATQKPPQPLRDALVRGRPEILDGLGEVRGHLGHYAEATTLLNEALADARHQTPQRRAELLAKIGHVQFQGGDVAASARSCEWALAELGAHLPGTRAGVRLGIAAQLSMRLLRALVPRRWLLLPEGPRRARARLDVKVSWNLSVATYFFDLDRSLYVAMRAHTRAEGIGESPELARCYSAHALACCLLPWYGRAVRYATEARDMARRLGSRWEESVASTYLGFCLYYGGRWDEARDALSACLEGFRAVGDPWQSAVALDHMAFIDIHRGDLDSALRLTEEQIDLTRQVGDRVGHPRALATSARALALRGEVPGALARAREAVALLEKTGNVVDTASAQITLGSILCRAGARDEAREPLHAAARTVTERLLRLDYVVPVWATLADALVGDPREFTSLDGGERRRRCAGAARPVARGLSQARAFPNHLPHALRIAARHRVLEGDWSGAEECWARAQSCAGRLGAVLEAGRALADQATLLRPRDAARAAAAAQEARAVFQRTGAHGDLASLDE